MARRWRRAGYGHTNFALVVAAWKRKKKQRRNRPYLSGIGRRRRSSASRGGGTTWSSKCGRCSPKGGTTTGRGTPREARGNAHQPTKPARRTAAGRRAARRSIRATNPKEGCHPLLAVSEKTLLGSSVNRGNGAASSRDCPRIYERRGKYSNLRGPQRVFGRGGDSAGLVGAALPSLPLRRDLYSPAPGVPRPVGPASSGECSQRGSTASARARGRRVSYRVGFGVLDRYRRGRKGGSGARVSGLSSTRGGFRLQ